MVSRFFWSFWLCAAWDDKEHLSSSHQSEKTLLDEKEPQQQQEGSPKDPNFLWIWLAVAAAAVTLLWGLSAWWGKSSSSSAAEKNGPQREVVTNRQFALFLGQFPEFTPKGNPQRILEASHAQESVSASDEQLFYYHTWQRQIGQDEPLRPIPATLLRQFLLAFPQWKQVNDSSSYTQYLKQLLENQDSTTAIVDKAIIPFELQLAVQNWRNKTQEAEQIASAQYTHEQVAKFLQRYPHFARNYWQNVLKAQYPHYLLSFSPEAPKAPNSNVVAEEELAPFLRQALYNFYTPAS